MFRLAQTGEFQANAFAAQHPMMTQSDKEDLVILRAHLKAKMQFEDFACIDDASVFAGEKRYLMMELIYPEAPPKAERMAELAAFQSKHPNQPNYFELIKAETAGDFVTQKELISDAFFPFAKRIQSVLLIRYWLNRLANVCYEIKRYKEAAYYYTLVNEEIRLLTSKHKTDPYGPASFKPTLK